jgi:hypothetical protein
VCFRYVLLLFVSIRRPIMLLKVARHTARILPLGGDASDEGGAAPAVAATSHVPTFASDVVTVDVVTPAFVPPVSPSKVHAASMLVAPSKFGSNQLPPNVMAELQVCAAVLVMHCSQPHVVPSAVYGWVR